MKPKFALDLSHEGINLLHRSKGGWSLVGSVALDDPDMGRHLADLRRAAAQLESGGVTCKIIIPNSQILYTTLEAPGPDDIAREVQIRSGLDGLTPYPVGELVFDWRGAGERARVAVLARDTMDEAETFAVEHRFNPVSFVARPPAGEFSGEPFFGKTRAATKILGPTERVEPDASPVPRRPRATEMPPPGATGPEATPDAPRAPTGEWSTGAAPHSPGDLAWQPPAEPAARSAPTAPKAPAPAPVPEPLDAPVPRGVPEDDPFAELDAIQAELSGDLDATPTFRSRASRGPTRPQPGDRGGEQPAPPPLAPFPPTSDEADALPAPPGATRKPRPAAKTEGADKAATSAARPDAAATAPRVPPPSATPDAAKPGPAPDKARPAASTRPPAATDAGGAPGTDDELPARPGVAFSTRRNGNGTTTTATPTARGPAPQPARPTDAGEPAARGARKDISPNDRRRADMADALSRPLPGSPAKAETPKSPESSGTRSSLTDAMRGAAGGLMSFGQRRAARKGEAKPAESSMAELMRGAGSNEARISPDQQADEPDLLAPGIAAGETPSAKAPVEPSAPGRDTQPAAPAAAKSPPDSAARKAAPATGKPAKPAVAPAPGAQPAAAVEPVARSQPSAPPPKPLLKPRTPAAGADKPKPPTTEAEALTIFGARQGPDRTSGRKYLGLTLTLLLLLAMAVIAMWSSFFVDDGDPALFNPGDTVAPADTPDAPAETTPDVAPVAPGAETTPETPPSEDVAPDADTPTTPDAALTPEVLSEEEAAARYAETQIWQRAPETLGEPFTPALDIGPIGGTEAARAAAAAPSAPDAPDLPDAPAIAERAAPLPPPPADTLFELDENGLVRPSPEGTVSPTGIIVFQGAPAVVPPAAPERPEIAAPDATAPEAVPETAAPGEAALEAALEEALEGTTGAEPDTSTTDPALLDTRPEPRPDDLPADQLPADDTTTEPEATAPDDARLDTGPADPTVDPQAEGAGSDASVAALAIEGAVDVAATTFVDASELAVATSIKPTRRPADIDQIVNAAMARAAAAPTPEPEPEPTAPATTTPAIPTSANVANQATTPNALDLREINLLGISGPSNARRALVRMENGRYVTVKVGDRLDGGRVTSITAEGLTYQKGGRSYSLQLLPLG